MDRSLYKPFPFVAGFLLGTIFGAGVIILLTRIALAVAEEWSHQL
jgi:hypothetical protein